MSGIVSGFLLGVISFGLPGSVIYAGLSSSIPSLLFFSGLIIRITIILTGFSLILNHHGDEVIVCLLGYTLARIFIMCGMMVYAKNLS